MFEVESLESFAADTRLFQIKTIFCEKLITLPKDAQFIWVDSNRRVGHCLAYGKTPQKTKKNVKNGLGALFGTFCSRFQIISSKDTSLWKIGHSGSEGAVHLDWFGQKGQNLEVKVWSMVRLLKKSENLSRMVLGGLFGTIVPLVSDRSK